MTEFVAGLTMYISWVTATYGTVALEGNYRTFTLTPTVDVLDGTAGADVNKVKYLGKTDIKADLEMLTQTGGTLLNSALNAGVQGTLFIGPEGTAVNKPKFTLPCFSTGAKYEYPYADMAKITCGFEANGAYAIGNW